jgi:ribosome biogenesis GTPase
LKNYTEILKEKNLSHCQLARVIREDREQYQVKIDDKEYRAEITGKIRFSAESRADYPAVGDWVAVECIDDTLAIIHDILPRATVLQRKAVASSDVQIIAANIDAAFIVQAVDRDFSINRLERYLAIAISGGIEPIALLNKIDLISDEERSKNTEEIKKRNPDLKIISMSALNTSNLAELNNLLEKNKTYCFLGSSGVGKSTIINLLLEDRVLETEEISESVQRGKHTTTHRELIILENKACVIDTPGMRELGLTEDSQSLESIFSEIYKYTEKCKYSDCTHTNEPGCGVLEALSKGLIEQEQYDNYHKLERETAYYQSTLLERRRKDKAFGKMVKEAMKNKKR